MTTTDPVTRAIVDRAHAAPNPVVVEAIARRMEYARLPWHRRIVTRRPTGWGRGRWGL
jgi:hypothetical protein